MKKLLYIFIFSVLFFNIANANCDAIPGDGVDLSNCQFSDEQDLTSTYIPNANLTRVNFKGSSLVEANFTNSNLFESDFTGANILNAVFEGANLNNATWVDGKKCNLGSIGECKQNN